MTLSPPERATERQLAKRLAAKITREGGMCSVCIHRDPQTVFGRGVCQTFGRSYPLCDATPGLKFEPDQVKLKGVSQCTSES